MKKIIFSIAVSAALLGSSAMYAADKDPNSTVKQAFVKEFAQVKDAEWNFLGKQGIYEVKFIYNNEQVRAFFNVDGEFLGTTRQITKSQLPIAVATELDKQYGDARLLTIFEYSKTDDLSYFITIMTDKGAKIIKATGNGDLSVYKKNAE